MLFNGEETEYAHMAKVLRKKARKLLKGYQEEIDELEEKASNFVAAAQPVFKIKLKPLVAPSQSDGAASTPATSAAAAATAAVPMDTSVDR